MAENWKYFVMQNTTKLNKMDLETGFALEVIREYVDWAPNAARSD